MGMLAEGQVEVADAERLLSKLAGSAEGEPRVKPADAVGSSRLKYLRVVVDSRDGNKVNIRVPLGLLRTGIKLSTMVPIMAGERLKASGIDLSHLSSLSGDELIEELRDLKIDVDSPDGDKVRVFCE
ncbi:MAG: hypothetical protein IH939_02130 [Acidobacteria bacterium]|nr:hypothetical protein [Acidobacteriota bacterium]